MAEINPIMPASVVTAVNRSRRQNQRKKQPPPEKVGEEKPDADEDTIPHIDELV